MPNWVYNEVEIEAPLAEVQSYLAEDSDPDGDDGKTLRFNLHRLFPEKFAADDLCGHKAWDYDWMIDNTGTKWNPSIHCASEIGGITHLGYDSAWVPNNELLERLHKITGWIVSNDYEEEQPEYEGSFRCEGGRCTDETRPGRPRCSNCEKRLPYEELDDDWGECPACIEKRGWYIVTLEPDGAAIINCGETKTVDLRGDVVLGIYSVHSSREALMLARSGVPEGALEGFDYENNPVEFGVRVYRLQDQEDGGD